MMNNDPIYHQALAASRREQYKKCQAACGCGEPAVSGHLIPRSHLNRLQPANGNVVVSGRYARELGLVRRTFPIVSVNDATTGYFTCAKHDLGLKIFDSFPQNGVFRHADIAVALDDLYLRGIMHQRWWMQRHAENARILTSDQIFKLPAANQLAAHEAINHLQNAERLLIIQKLVERCKSNSTLNGMLVHSIFRATALPHLAAYQLGVATQPPWENGVTLHPIQVALIPLDTAYIFAISSTAELASLARRLVLGATDSNAAPTSTQITRAILSTCETLAFSEVHWSSLSPDYRQLAVDAHCNAQATRSYHVDLLPHTQWQQVIAMQKRPSASKR